MKNIKVLIIILLSGVFSVANAGNNDTIRIHTSAQCGMCKEKIESNIVFEKGIKTVFLDLETKDAIIVYNAEKNSPENLRIAISKLGYDADSIPANPKAYKKLSPCCKKPDDPDYKGH